MLSFDGVLEDDVRTENPSSRNARVSESYCSDALCQGTTLKSGRKGSNNIWAQGVCENSISKLSPAGTAELSPGR